MCSYSSRSIYKILYVVENIDFMILMVHFDLFVYIQTTKGQPKTVDVLVCVELH